MNNTLRLYTASLPVNVVLVTANSHIILNRAGRLAPALNDPAHCRDPVRVAEAPSRTAAAQRFARATHRSLL
jgi:hypothetical protein